MKKLFAAASIAGLLSGAATAQGVYLNRDINANPQYLVDASGSLLGTSANPLTVTGGTGGGGGSVPTGTAGSPNAAVVSVQGISGGTPQSTTITSALPAGSNAIGSITNSTFGATQSGTWNIANVTGTVSLPTGAATATNQATEITNLTAIATRSSYFVETNTPLAANGSFTGPTHDAGATPSPWATFKCFFNANQASFTNGAYIQISDDNVSWTTTAIATTLAAGVPATLSSPIFARYNRCILTNGTTAQTILSIRSEFGAN